MYVRGYLQGSENGRVVTIVPLVVNKHRSTSVQLRLIFRQIGNEFDIEDTTANNLINTCKIMLPFTEMS
jgi:hypothetical protein